MRDEKKRVRGRAAGLPFCLLRDWDLRRLFSLLSGVRARRNRLRCSVWPCLCIPAPVRSAVRSLQDAPLFAAAEPLIAAFGLSAARTCCLWPFRRADLLSWRWRSSGIYSFSCRMRPRSLAGKREDRRRIFSCARTFCARALMFVFVPAVYPRADAADRRSLPIDKAEKINL